MIVQKNMIVTCIFNTCAPFIFLFLIILGLKKTTFIYSLTHFSNTNKYMFSIINCFFKCLRNNFRIYTVQKGSGQSNQKQFPIVPNSFEKYLLNILRDSAFIENISSPHPAFLVYIWIIYIYISVFNFTFLLKKRIILNIMFHVYHDDPQ